MKSVLEKIINKISEMGKVTSESSEDMERTVKLFADLGFYKGEIPKAVHKLLWAFVDCFDILKKMLEKEANFIDEIELYPDVNDAWVNSQTIFRYKQKYVVLKEYGDSRWSYWEIQIIHYPLKTNMANFQYIKKIVESEGGVKLLLRLLKEESDFTVAGYPVYAFIFKTERGQRGVVVSFGCPIHIYKYYPKLPFKDPLIACSYLILEEIYPFHSRRLIRVARSKDSKIFIAQWGTKDERIYIAIVDNQMFYSLDLKELYNILKMEMKIEIEQKQLEWKRICNEYLYPHQRMFFR